MGQVAIQLGCPPQSPRGWGWGLKMAWGGGALKMAWGLGGLKKGCLSPARGQWQTPLSPWSCHSLQGGGTAWASGRLSRLCRRLGRGARVPGP